ncbi:hypothetical protein C8J57DRAFT_1493654 [Mycena rebaudengoi]|nr:hypothetical protein C8J57DRAFT_1493654 [Mycena rebaudengoi]
MDENSELEEETSRLRRSAHISPHSTSRHLWDFCVLDDILESTDSNSGDITVHLRRVRKFWHPETGKLEVPEEWAGIILPPVLEDPLDYRYSDTKIWLRASLLSAIISPLASQLSLVPATDLDACVTPDYCGPKFPSCPPDGGSSNIHNVVLLLMHSSGAGILERVASLFNGTPGCQLKWDPGASFSSQFGEEIPKVDFACVPEWQPTSKAMINRSRRLPLCLSSPALAIGIQLDDKNSNCQLNTDELTRLADVVQPHLEAVLIAWHCRHSSPPDVGVCIFGIALRNSHVFVVAHIPYLHLSEYRYKSIILDQISFPPSYDPEASIARLRLIIALLTIQTHVGRLASLWESISWPPIIIDSELTRAQEFSGIPTPTPSEVDGSGAEWLKDILDGMELETGHEVYDLTPPDSDILHSKEIVNTWLGQVNQ